jgi:hypothetical protein
MRSRAASRHPSLLLLRVEAWQPRQCVLHCCQQLLRAGLSQQHHVRRQHLRNGEAFVQQQTPQAVAQQMQCAARDSKLCVAKGCMMHTEQLPCSGCTVLLYEQAASHQAAAHVWTDTRSDLLPAGTSHTFAGGDSFCDIHLAGKVQQALLTASC